MPQLEKKIKHVANFGYPKPGSEIWYRHLDGPLSQFEIPIMIKCMNSPGFKGRRFTSEIIDYAVWLYFRFSLSLRDVEDLMAGPGIIGSHETVRLWVSKLGRQYAKPIRRNRPIVGDK